MDGQNWRRLKRIAPGYTWKRRPDFFQVYLNLYESAIDIARKSSFVKLPLISPPVPAYKPPPGYRPINLYPV